MVRNQGGNTTEELTIWLLARAAEVNVETIRYYQRRGLLEEPAKPLGGRRRYSEVAVRRVRFIKRAQQLGFTLEEVKNLLLLEDGQSCRETRLFAEHKLVVIEQRVAIADWGFQNRVIQVSQRFASRSSHKRSIKAEQRSVGGCTSP
jgi:MerR family mercuric resistance operon transcriptional regulator